MLRLIEVGNALPISYPVAPGVEFQPGMVGQFDVVGNEVVVGVSNGRAPIGIIDDIRSRAFSKAQIDEVVVIPTGPGAIDPSTGGPITTVQTMTDLEFPNIVRSSFTTTVTGVILNEVNGTLIAPVGTPINFDNDQDGIPDSIRTIVSYTYHVANIPGDDSTQGSNRITLWFTRGIFETDQFDTTQQYPINQLLYVNREGTLTSMPPDDTAPGVAILTGPPSSLLSTIEFMWL